jgi:DNA-binding IclR family transcriptional regulator
MSIQSVQRAVAILRCLSGSRRLGVSELSEQLDLAKGTIHGLLATLRDEGFVEQDSDTGKYQLGHTLLELGTSYLDVNELRQRALARADWLAQKTQCSVRVAVLRGGHALIVHHVFRPDNSLQILEVGSNFPLHATALGKVLSAYLNPELKTLSRLTKNTQTDSAKLSAEWLQIREQGWALENEEAVLSEAGFAAPIVDRKQETIGAIGISGAVRELLLDGEPRAELVQLVLEAARHISRELGARLMG